MSTQGTEASSSTTLVERNTLPMSIHTMGPGPSNPRSASPDCNVGGLSPAVAGVVGGILGAILMLVFILVLTGVVVLIVITTRKKRAKKRAKKRPILRTPSTHYIRPHSVITRETETSPTTADAPDRIYTACIPPSQRHPVTATPSDNPYDDILDQNTDPYEEMLPPKEIKSLNRETKTTQEKTKTLPQVTKTVPQETKTVPQETKTVPQETKTMPRETKTMPRETGEKKDAGKPRKVPEYTVCIPRSKRKKSLPTSPKASVEEAAAEEEEQPGIDPYVAMSSTAGHNVSSSKPMEVVYSTPQVQKTGGASPQIYVSSSYVIPESSVNVIDNVAYKNVPRSSSRQTELIAEAEYQNIGSRQ